MSMPDALAVLANGIAYAGGSIALAWVLVRVLIEVGCTVRSHLQMIENERVRNWQRPSATVTSLRSPPAA